MRTSLNSKPISEIHQQYVLGNVNLSPDYQRKLVWPFKNKVYLIDSIIQGLPLPKFFVQIKVDITTGRTIYEMVDGQQRLSTIMEFINGRTNDGKEFILTRKEHPDPNNFLSELEGKKFQTLTKEHQNGLWLYKLSMEELTEATEREVKDMFVRLNLSNVKLTPQELRNAIFNGDFKKMVYKLTEEFDDEYFVKYKIIPVSQVKRMADAEFTSELLISMIRGITDKKSKIDDVYNQCDTMDHDEVIRLQREFRKILNLIEEIFGDDLSTTRYKNKNDFYSVFYLFFDLIFKKNYRIDVNSYSSIKKTLIKMSLEVKDSTTNKDMLDYYIGVNNAGDTDSNRHHRHKCLFNLIEPYCIPRDRRRDFSEFEKQFLWHSSESKLCGICGNSLDSYSEYEIDHVIPWSRGGNTTLENAQISHSECNRRKSDS